MKELLSTKELAQMLGVNEKMVYSLISEKNLPATKVTGKWLFPARLVEEWIDANTINHPSPSGETPEGLLIAAGSNDILLERAMGLFMRRNPGKLVVFGNVGSRSGLEALARGQCHMAASHLVQDDDADYNFAYAEELLPQQPAVVNFCRREQGFITAQGNPKKIASVSDLASKKLTMVNRPASTGTRLLFDREAERAGLGPSDFTGYEKEVSRHLDVGLEVLAGRADAGPGVKAAAIMLNLGFASLGWERFDLLIPKQRFFDRDVQLFLSLFSDAEFKELAAELTGYDVSMSGKVVFPRE